MDFHVVDGKFQGSRTHLIELLSRTVLLSSDIEFIFFLNGAAELGDISPAFKAANVRAVQLGTDNPLARMYWRLPALSRRYELGLIHTQYVLPYPAFCRRVVTIHDILFETHPQYFTSLFTARSRLLMRHAARAADHVFVVSRYTLEQIRDRYGVPAERISVLYNGVDNVLFSTNAENDSEILRGRGLKPSGYLLSVGRLEPRKNQEALVRAYARLGGDAPPLVLVGQRDFRFEGVFRAITEEGVTERVRILENVSDDELPALYRHAKLFAYPTFAEGFGIPLVEAMAAGVPVISSAVTAIPEIVGEDAAVLIDPSDIGQLAEAMRRVLRDDVLRAGLISAGHKRAERFSWQESAKLLRERYLALLGNPGGECAK